MADAYEQDGEELRDPTHFLHISRSYSAACRVLIEDWDRSNIGHNDRLAMLFHPVSQPLGTAMETAIKGLLLVYGDKFPKTHDLEELFRLIEDENVTLEFASILDQIEIPTWFEKSNGGSDPSEIRDLFSRHHLHIHLLNLQYGRPYRARYPITGGSAIYDPIFIIEIIKVLQRRISAGLADWAKAQ